MSLPHSSIDDRRALCETPCTLDGKRARICGAAELYAEIRQLPDGFGWHWSWPAVAHILENREGKFRS